MDSARPPPAFDQPSGEIVGNMQLQMSSSVSDSEIYFTVDGNDPITSDGQLADSALRYEQAIPIHTTMRVIARIRQADEWSAATMADYFVPLALQVSEIQAKALPSADFTPDDFDFLELMNTGEFPIDLSAVRFVRGIRFDFQSAEIQTLEPQQRIVLVQNRQAFLQRYPEAASHVAGTYSGRLKGRDTLLAVGEWDRPIIHFTYDTDWYKIADDEFFSLVLQDEFMDVDASDVVRMADSSRWRPSHYVNGSPGTSDPGYAQDAIVISEALTHSDGNPGDYLELHNTTDHDIDLSGWYLSGRASQLDLYRIANGTILPAHGFLYFSATAPPVPTQNFGGIMGFNISKLGEKIYVTSAGRSPEELGGYRYVAKFGYGFNSSSFILHTNSVGEQEYLIALERTPGFPNGSPVAVERLRDNERPFREAVINEVMYFPQGNGDEFIELYNPHRTPAYLDQPFGPSWRLTDGVFLDLPATAIPPFSYALLVGIGPDAFRQKYSVPEDVAIFGPYAGEMLNSGERIVLSRAAGPTSIIPFSVTDQLHYNSPAAAWPEQAQGHGASLVRNSLRMQGNDPLAWSAGNDGGTPGKPNQRWDESSFIVDRMLFYNDSRFDDNNLAINADQLAIMVDKFAMNLGVCRSL
ncbi:MAG: lamin tail domain-containing protein [Pirellulaceae bacterium]